jgi:Peptidase M10 serralysin C terminal/Matrixin
MPNRSPARGARPITTQSLTTSQAAEQLTRDGGSWTATLGSGTSVSWAARSTAGTGGGGGFSRLSVSQVAAVRSALTMWSSVANLTFVEIAPGSYSNNATMLFGNYYEANGDAQAYAYYPSPFTSAANFDDGDVWFNTFYQTTSTTAFGSYDYLVVLHEIGHALGLAHPGNYNAGSGGPITYAGSAEYIEDTLQYSVMSYFAASDTGATHTYAGQTIYARTLLLHDIAAIQRLYGANTASRTGNTTYGFGGAAGDVYTISSGTEQVVYAIWDTGGTDTLNFSLYANAQYIDLRAGMFSNVGALTRNVSIAEGAVIENAIGGNGNDIVVGNDAANGLYGSNGNDAFYGGAGNDIIDGGAGTNYAHWDGSAGQISIVWRSGTTFTITDSVANRGGQDTVTGVRYATFGASYNVAALDLYSIGSSGAYAWATSAAVYAPTRTFVNMAADVAARDFSGSSVVGYAIFATGAYRAYNQASGQWVAANTWTYVSGATLASLFHYGGGGGTDTSYVIPVSANGRSGYQVSLVYNNQANAATAAALGAYQSEYDQAGRSFNLNSLLYTSGGGAPIAQYYINIVGAGSVTVGSSTFTAASGWFQISAANWAAATFTTGATTATLRFGAQDTLGITTNLVDQQVRVADLSNDRNTLGRAFVGGDFRGNITVGDGDRWLIYLGTGNYTFGVQGAGSATAGNTLSDGRVTLYSGSGATLAVDDDSGAGLDANLFTTIRTAGYYYVGVSGFSGASGTYTLRVTAGGAAPGSTTSPGSDATDGDGPRGGCGCPGCNRLNGLPGSESTLASWSNGVDMAHVASPDFAGPADGLGLHWHQSRAGYLTGGP